MFHDIRKQHYFNLKREMLNPFVVQHIVLLAFLIVLKNVLLTFLIGRIHIKNLNRVTTSLLYYSYLVCSVEEY
ncbi:hypothetical protein RJT34_03255 [Clitoria ternatea]|uniref:Uncharacterized protein n=1 Tax=Clitoria ternatea TaxID=43366 RepID=A0AAN9KJH8_CLITE